MNDVSLDRLRTFQAVYRVGTLTEASTILGLSQPAVSGQLRALERSLGQALFVRRARGVTPTAAAVDLARRLDGPLDALAGIASSLAPPAVAVDWTIHLGGPAELTSLRVLPALAELVPAGLSIRVQFGLAEALLADLTAARLDLVVSAIRPRGRGLTSAPLFDEEFVLVAAPEVARTISVDELRQRPAWALRRLPLLAYGEDLPIVRRWWRHVLGVAPSARAVVVAPDLRAVLAATVAGAGATVLPTYLCRNELARGELVEVLTSDDPPINTLYLAARTAMRTHPGISRVWDTVVSAARGW